MALRVQTQISGDVFTLRCDGRIVFGDEGAILRERVGNMLMGTPRWEKARLHRSSFYFS